jgi:hypothetical protein
MRLIVRAERPHPGRSYGSPTSRERLTALVTNIRRGQANLELRHRGQVRCEDRIRATKDLGLRNLLLHDFNQNHIWAALAMLAQDRVTPTRGHPGSAGRTKRSRLTYRRR